MTEKPYVIIFDWDDTLLDAGMALVQSKINAIKETLEDQTTYPFCKEWRCPTMRELRKHAGHRFKEKVIHAVMPQLDADNTDHQAWINDAFDRFKKYYRQTEKHLFPGVTAMLNQLQKNCDLCIATNKSRDLFTEELHETRLEAFFTHIVCGDDLTLEGKFKPHPRMLNMIQSYYPNDTRFVMVGDRDFDIIAARSSNQARYTKTIGISQTQELDDANCQLKSSAEISMALIEKLFVEKAH